MKLMFRRMYAIAKNAFRESIRNKILYTLLFFAVGMIGFSVLLGNLALGDVTKIVRSIGLAAVHLIAVAISVFVGTRLVAQEIEQRTVFTIVSKPVRRWEFVVGKFLGLAALLLFEIALLGGAYLAVVYLSNSKPNPQLAIAMLAIWVECLVVVGMSLFYSSFAGSVPALLFVIGTWFIGHLAGKLHELAKASENTVVQTLGAAVAGLVPNLQFLDFKHQAVHGVAMSASFITQALFYGFGWAALFLLAACLIFERRAFDQA